MPTMPELANMVADGERFLHRNTGKIYVVQARDATGRLRIRREDYAAWVWPDYLLNPHNYERMGPPVVLR